MAARNMKDGEDFHFPSDFGFSGSAGHKPARSGQGEPVPAEGSFSYPAEFGFSGSNNDVKPPKVASPKKSAKAEEKTAEHMAEGGHMTHHKDGSVVHHHANGGKTIVHADGRVERHHPEGGHSVHYPDGRSEFHDSSEYAFRSGGHMADEMQDEQMVTKGVHQHESNLHHGEPETEMHLAKGGAIGMRARFPKGMRPHVEGLHTPVNTAPRDPKLNRSATNDMPGGMEPYGVQPTTEPDQAGSDQGIPQLRRGGRMRE